MRRHVIIGRFGPGDRGGVPVGPDEVSTRLELVAGERSLDHGLSRAIADLGRLNLHPSEIGVDLMVLAAHVHAADTRISRTSESQDSWTREIRLVVPVSDVERWNGAVGVLQRMLNFLTGDKWLIGFRARPPRFAAICPRRPPGLFAPPFDSLGLFSGGLDSLIGAIDELEDGRTPLLVSHAGEGATSDAQNTLFDELKAHYAPRSLARLRLWMAFPEGLVRDSGPENTTRGRSFLFFSAGIFTGTCLRSPFSLRVPENGLIALNVPLDPLRLGACSTRTTHPFYMSRWNELLELVGIEGRVINPYWDTTKGEMVGGCLNKRLLRDLVPESLSCASPTKGRWQGYGTQHCGYCLPCLIRRAALEEGLGRGADPTSYTVPDLTAYALDTKQAEGQQVRSFQFAIERLRREPGAARFLIHKPGPLSDEPASWDALVDVYTRGLGEVERLLEGVRTMPG